MKIEHLPELLRILRRFHLSPAAILILLVIVVALGAFSQGASRVKTNDSEEKKGLAAKETAGESRFSSKQERNSERAEEVWEAGETLFGRVVRVDDGDTVWLESETGQNVRIRFQGIDAPEKGQDFGNRARQHLNSLVHEKKIRVKVDKTDQYGRIVGRIFLDSPSGSTDIEESMLRAGLAWHYSKFNNERNLAAAQKEARDQKCGLWSQKNPIPPWKWRWEQRNKNSEEKDSGKKEEFQIK